MKLSWQVMLSHPVDFVLGFLDEIWNVSAVDLADCAVVRGNLICVAFQKVAQALSKNRCS